MAIMQPSTGRAVTVVASDAGDPVYTLTITQQGCVPQVLTMTEAEAEALSIAIAAVFDPA